MYFTKKNHEDIQAAIRNSELKTSGEIVPVILNSSDFYPASHLRAALIGGFFFSILTYLFYELRDPIILLSVQVIGIIVGYLVAYMPFLKRALSTKNEMKEETYQCALQIFHEHRVSVTKERIGILIFISLSERRVHLLTDVGINDRVEDEFWDQVVSKLSIALKNGQIIEGLIEAINTCGVELENNFPRKFSDENEIIDELITDIQFDKEEDFHSDSIIRPLN